jgi:hypothetical protein
MRETGNVSKVLIKKIREILKLSHNEETLQYYLALEESLCGDSPAVRIKMRREILEKLKE